jgi:hypothetical protein
MLLARHRTFHEQLTAAGLSAHPYYQPDHWMPHCTVGFHLPAPAVGQAVALCRHYAHFGQPFLISSIRLIEFQQVAPPAGDAQALVSTVTTLGQYQF